MTLQRRRRRNSDIFDTGAFGSYARLGTSYVTSSDAIMRITRLNSFRRGNLNGSIVSMSTPTTEEVYKGYPIKIWDGGTTSAGTYLFIVEDKELQPNGVALRIEIAVDDELDSTVDALKDWIDSLSENGSGNGSGNGSSDFTYKFNAMHWAVYDSSGTLLETGEGPNPNRNAQLAQQWIASGAEPTYPSYDPFSDDAGGIISGTERLEEYYNGFFYSFNSTNWAVYDSAMTILHTATGSDSASNYQAAINWIDSGAEPTYPVVDPFDDTGSTTQYNWLMNVNKDEIVYSSWKDVYYAQVELEIITLDEGRALASERLGHRTIQHTGWPGVWAQNMVDYDPSGFIVQFDTTRQDELDAGHNPGQPINPYQAGEYISPWVGNATMYDQPVTGQPGDHYWDGNLATHDWGFHGISTLGITAVDTKQYPKPICDPIGGYAMSISHYIADYDNITGDFRGFRALNASEADGGIPAGIPIATVMQMFTKPPQAKKGGIFESGTDFGMGSSWYGANFYLDCEKKPIWREAVGMPMSPESFFLLEPELANENKITKINNSGITWDAPQTKGVIPYTISASGAEKHFSSGHNGRKSVFPNGVSREDALNREFGGVGWGNFRIAEKSKIGFAAKVEWLGEDGLFSEYSKHPQNIPDCNTEGKTMVIYRFPRQLDPVVDKDILDKYSGMDGIPDYSFTKTKYCYPYPGASADKDEFALIGRIRAENSDTIGAEKYKAEIDGETFAARQSIRFIPMVSPSLPPSDKHRPYMINNPGAMKMSEILSVPTALAMNLWKKRLSEKVDRICFNTDVSGARISVADPEKVAYFNNSKISNAYFIDKDFTTGSVAFAIGQCMLAYEIDSGAIDTRLGIVDASERMILTTKDSIMSSEKVGQSSNKLFPRGAKDGQDAGKKAADYLPPTAVITTADLDSLTAPVGMTAVKETFKELYGYELTKEWFATLDLGEDQDPNDPSRYTVTTTYGTFSYPYSIVAFTIPGYYNGPILAVDEEGTPIEATSEYPGYLGTKNAYIKYQSLFGNVKSHTVNIAEEIRDQGAPPDIDKNPFGKGYYDQTGLRQKTVQFELWLQSRLIEDYGNVRFTDTSTKAYFKWWNEDYVTGKMLVEAGFPIPNVDLRPYYEEAATAGIPIYVEETETESQDAQASGVAGFGAFTDSSGFTVTDVTSKWGALGSASPRYTGDVGMSMVPYKANVTNEQLGYLALSNLEGVENPTNISGLGGPLDDVSEGVGDGFRYGGILAGSGFAVAGIGIAGAAIMVGSVAAVNIIAARKSADKLAEKLAGKV